MLLKKWTIGQPLMAGVQEIKNYYGAALAVCVVVALFNTLAGYILRYTLGWLTSLLMPPADFDITSAMGLYEIMEYGNRIRRVDFFISFLELFLLTVFLSFILQVGLNRFFLEATRGRRDFRNVFSFLKQGYWSTLSKMLMWFLTILGWSLLLILPGIYKALQYSMVPFIVAERRDLSWQQTLALSKQMTKGHLGKMLLLYLLLLAWYPLLSLLVSHSMSWVFSWVLYGLYLCALPVIHGILAQVYLLLAGPTNEPTN